MSSVIKKIYNIQLNKIAYSHNLFKAVITYESHPTEHDESDELEYQKNFIKKNLINNLGDKLLYSPSINKDNDSKMELKAKYIY